MYNKDEATLKRITLLQLSQLIEINKSEGNSKGIKMSWGFKQSYIYAKLEKNGVVVFEQFYQGKHTHVHLAEMHIDFYNEMLKHNKIVHGDSGRA